MKVLKKMSFDALVGNISIEDMKFIMAGSGSVVNGSSYTQQTTAGFAPGGGSGNMWFYATDRGLSSQFSITGTLLFTPNGDYNNPSISSNQNAYGYGSANYGATYNSGYGSGSIFSNAQGWTSTGDGIITTNPNDINRFINFVKYNSVTDPQVSWNKIANFLNNEQTIEGRALNNGIYGAINLNEVIIMNNYKGPSSISQGINYENGVLSLGVMMGSGGVMMGSGGSINNPANIKPSAEFLASPFGEVYNKLTNQNNNFLCLLEKFNNSKTFNLSYIYSSVGMPSTFDAQTSVSLIVQGKTIIGANVTQQFDPAKIFGVSVNGNVTKTYERSEIGKVTDILHEALHTYININGVSSGGDHTAYNQYRTLLIDTLTEYNIDNNLGFTASQINELAFKGTFGSSNTAPSEQFSCYIQSIAEKNGTTYNEEFKTYENRLSDLNWTLVSTKTN